MLVYLRSLTRHRLPRSKWIGRLGQSVWSATQWEKTLLFHSLRVWMYMPLWIILVALTTAWLRQTTHLQNWQSIYHEALKASQWRTFLQSFGPLATHGFLQARSQQLLTLFPFVDMLLSWICQVWNALLHIEDSHIRPRSWLNSWLLMGLVTSCLLLLGISIGEILWM